MDPMIIGGAVVGLAMGSFGYVLVRFGARPVLVYRRFKRHLTDLLDALDAEEDLKRDRRDALRRTAVALQDLIDTEVPTWYILSLRKKGEHPKEAVRHLQTLANCKDPTAIQRRSAAVRESLGLPEAASKRPA